MSDRTIPLSASAHPRKNKREYDIYPRHYYYYGTGIQVTVLGSPYTYDGEGDNEFMQNLVG
jgi:hypothetical protein